MKALKDSEHEEVQSLLRSVYDPEIPVLSIVDLGVVRDVRLLDPGVEVTITPTYSGCPAMKLIEENIKDCLSVNGYDPVQIKTVLSPAWTTDWLTESGKNKLREYGIAPPQKATPDKNALFSEPKQIACPQCKSVNTKLVSQFGSTACKALYKCQDCLEPFDYFKCL